MSEIMIYGVVGDEFDGLTASALVPRIAAMTGDIVVRINSPGGFIVEGLAIFTALDRVRGAGRKVTIHIDGVAASIASTIAMAGTEIIMAENGLMMVHNPWDSKTGDAAALRKQADILDKVRDQMVAIYAARTGLDVGDLAMMLAVETWMSAEEALSAKFITSIAPAMKMAACDVSSFGFRQAPESPLIAKAAAAGAGTTKAAAADLPPKETEAMSDQDTKPAADKKPADNLSIADVEARISTAVAAETTRVTTIRSLADRHKIDAKLADKLIADKVSLEDARAQMLDALAAAGDAANVGHNSPARVTQDARDKFRKGATNWLLVKAGVAPMIEKAAAMRGETIKIDPGEFRGVRNVDLAREALGNIGVAVTSRDPDLIVREAMTARGAVITQTTSDFPVLFENAIHRTLQAAYATTPDTWSRFCGTGTVTDFRDHSRYLRGSFGALDNVNEAGEFKNKPIPDLAKEKIRATTKGNIINLSRQAIVNDDMEVFSGLAVDLGRAAKLTIEIDVFALINSNPLMNDGIALFDAAHGNLAGSGAAPSVTAFDAMRVAMASQKDISGNEFLDIRPSILLLPIALGGGARIINQSQYDPDAVNKLQRPNIVAGLFSDIVDTPRLAGTAYYAFADPNVAPAIEVVFLNGNTEPFTDSQDGWRVDGVEWKVRHDYGVGAVNFRSAFKQPGA